MAAGKLTDKQLLFANEYLKDLNATAAAKRAGYSEKTAHVIGCENLKKPNVREYIQKRLDELTLSAEETLKSLSDIARADLKKYLVVRKVLHRPKVSLTLAEYIERRKDEIEKARYVHQLALNEGLLGTGDVLQANIDAHNSYINSIRYDIIQLEVRLAHEPNATVIVDGPEELVETADIDLAKLAQDQDAGRVVKSFTQTEYGPKVEMYSGDAALRDLGRYHGLFKDKLEHTGKNGGPIETKSNVDYDSLPDEVLEAIIHARKKED